MSTSFGNNNGILFNQLGLTTVLNGITLTQTLYNSTTGETTISSYVPTSLNYVLGGAITSQTLLPPAAAFLGLSAGVLSLTTNSSRITEISLLSSSANTNSGYLDVSSANTTTTAGCHMRCIRGPSTAISTITNLFNTATSTRLPITSYKWMDFTPPSGAATYVIECSLNGASTQIVLANIQMFVRQI